jgi:hypothetical protein
MFVTWPLNVYKAGSVVIPVCNLVARAVKVVWSVAVYVVDSPTGVLPSRVVINIVDPDLWPTIFIFEGSISRKAVTFVMKSISFPLSKNVL